MKVGFIGISSLTLELAFRSAQAGFKVRICNLREKSLTREGVEKMGANAKLCSLKEIGDMEIIVLFTPRDDLEKIIKSLPDMTGKLMIHTGSLIFDPFSLLSIITDTLTSEIIALRLPEARIVKLFCPVNLQYKSNWTDCKRNEEVFFIADYHDSANCASDF